MAKSEEAGTQAAGSRQPEWHEAGGRGQEAEGGGQRKPRTGGGIGATPCPGAGPSPSTTLNHWLHQPPRAPRQRETEGGVGTGWRGSRIKLAGLHNTLKPPSASQAPTPSQIGGARARRRASRSELVAGGVGGGSPSRRLSAAGKFW